MLPGGLEGVGVVFSLVTGTAAALLSILTWEILKRSPLGRGVQVLSITLFLFTIYHALILVFPNAVILTQFVKTGLFAGIAVFILLLIVNDHRLRDTAERKVR